LDSQPPHDSPLKLRQLSLTVHQSQPLVSKSLLQKRSLNPQEIAQAERQSVLADPKAVRRQFTQKHVTNKDSSMNTQREIPNENSEEEEDSECSTNRYDSKDTSIAG